MESNKPQNQTHTSKTTAISPPHTQNNNKLSSTHTNKQQQQYESSRQIKTPTYLKRRFHRNKP